MKETNHTGPERGQRNRLENDMATLNLLSSAIEIGGHKAVSASPTPNGWMWFSNVGRVGKRTDYQTASAALRAAARTMGIKITEVVQ